MFDDLDDPSFAGPGAGARVAVAARAGRIRRNRRLAWTSGVASVVVLVLALTTMLRPGSRGLAGVEPLAPASVFTPASETPTPTPTATAAESPTPTPERTPPRTIPVPSRSSVPVLPVSPAPHDPRRDRIGDWMTENAIHGCDPAAELPDPGQAPHPAITMTLEMPDVIDADAPGRGKITFTNTSSDVHAYFAFYAANSDRNAGLLQTVAAGAGTFSGVTWWREGPRHRENTYGVNIGPGESRSYDVEVITETCDPPRRQDVSYKGSVELLDPGTYQMSVGIYVFEADIIAPEEASPSPPPGCCARWATAPITVRVR